MNCTRDAGEESRSVLLLRVERVTADENGVATTLYCTDVEGTELRVAIGDPPTAGPDWKTGQWYRFDGVVRSTTPGAELLFSAGDGGTERVAPPEGRPHPPPAELDDPWLIQLGASDEVVAVTVQPRPTDGTTIPRADAPETFEIGAVCFAHHGADATVYHREEPDTRDEHLLLQHVVADLSELEGATLVTHGTGRSPLGMLRARLELAAGGDVVDEGGGAVLDACFHADLARVANRAGDGTLTATARRLGIEHAPVRLDDYETGLDPVNWRDESKASESALSDVSDPRMIDRDYAVLVERYLGTDDESAAATELGRCLKAYASADLPLLEELAAHDATAQLGCPRSAGLPSRG
jgi:hypothetical protein